MKALRHAQIRSYFFGHGENSLAPTSQTADFGDLSIFKIIEGTYRLLSLPKLATNPSYQAQTRTPNSALATTTTRSTAPRARYTRKSRRRL